MRIKLIIIFLLTVVGVLSTVYWKEDHDFFADKIRWNEAQSRSEMSAITQSLETEIEGLTQILDLAYSMVAESKNDYTTDQAYSRFQMIAKLNPQHQIDQAYFLDKSTVKSWGINYAALTLNSIAKNGKDFDLKLSQMFILLSPERKPWVLLVTKSKVTKNQYAAIVAPDFLQEVIDRQKGQMSSLEILNSQNQILGHTTPEYVGSLAKEDPMAVEFLQSGNASGSGIFNGLQNERVHGFYEKVNDSNLYVEISTPLRILMAEQNKIKMRFIFMGFGISLLGVALLLMLDRADESSWTQELVKNELKTEPLKSTPLPHVEQAHTEQEDILSAKTSIPFAPSTPAAPLPPAASLPQKPDEKFEALFGSRKIEDAFRMIDSLESPPPAPQITSQTTPVPPAAPLVEVKPATILTAEVSTIRIQKKESRLDQLDVKIRNPIMTKTEVSGEPT